MLVAEKRRGQTEKKNGRNLFLNELDNIHELSKMLFDDINCKFLSGQEFLFFPIILVNQYILK